MRLTPFWVLAGLAIGLPAAMLAWLAAQHPEARGEGWGFFSLIVMAIAVFAFLVFGAWALVAARPKVKFARILRRLALAIAAFLAFMYGFNAASIVLNEHAAVVLLGPAAALLLAAGVGATYALLIDLLVRSPQPPAEPSSS